MAVSVVFDIVSLATVRDQQVAGEPGVVSCL